ncbi:hypothetical protein EOM81_01695 [bacterium]|nr:hypothetical protein [bacterium]
MKYKIYKTFGGEKPVLLATCSLFIDAVTFLKRSYPFLQDADFKLFKPNYWVVTFKCGKTLRIIGKEK